MNAWAGSFNTDLAQRLGWGLLHSLWEGVLGAALFGLLRFGLRRRSANARYLAACLMLGVLFALPILTTIWWARSSRTIPAGKSGAEPGSVPAEIRPTEAKSSEAAIDIPVYVSRTTELLDAALPWLVQLWLGGVVALSCRWFAGTRWVRRVRTVQTTIPSLDLQLRVQALRRRLGITLPVRLLKSALVEVPMVVGWLRPVILLPASALSGLTPRQLEAVLAHELAHIRRHDYLVNFIQQLIETLMFYHPAVWWVSGCIREERENCCDDLVIQTCGNRMDYVRALVGLEEGRGGEQLALAATGGSLLCRVRRLLGSVGEGHPPSPGEFSGITLVAIGCVMISLGVWQYRAPGSYEAAALVKVDPNGSQQRFGREPGPGELDPSFIRTECLVVSSPAVLGPAALKLTPPIETKLAPAGPPPPSIETLHSLKQKLHPVPVANTWLIQIRASDSDPERAARTANAVAAAYQEYRRDQRRACVRAEIDSLQACFEQQARKIRVAAAEVDRQRARVDISDPEVSEDVRAVALSGETLHHLEALRIETETDYIKQKTLLDRLEKLDAEELPATIQAVGIPDNQLTSLLDSRALVDQRLIGLRKEYGPAHIEVVKLEAQDSYLRDKISGRTRGILAGLQAKMESVNQGLVALRKALAQGQIADVRKAESSRAYLEAKRNLQELERFRDVLETKIVMELTTLRQVGDDVEIVEQAVPPPLALAPNRRRLVTLVGAGCSLVLVGCLLTRTGGAGGRRPNGGG